MQIALLPLIRTISLLIITATLPNSRLPFGTLLTRRVTPYRIIPEWVGVSSVATVPKPTQLARAQLPAMRTALPATSPNTIRLVRGPVSQESATVTRGTAYPGVTRTRVAEASTYAPSVAPSFTTPSNATWLRDLLIINTPFIPDEWEKMLNDITPFNKFSDVPISLRSGFNMGVHSPPLFTYTPPNHNSALAYPDHVLSISIKNYRYADIPAPSLVPDSNS
jgi:hypothetical protein